MIPADLSSLNSGKPRRQDNKPLHCPDVPSLLLRRRYCTKCKITFYVAAPSGCKEEKIVEAVALFLLGAVATATSHFNLLYPNLFKAHCYHFSDPFMKEKFTSKIVSKDTLADVNINSFLSYI